MKKPPTDIIILHMCTINDNHMMYGSWDMKLDRQNFLSFWTCFFPLYLPNNPKNQNFEKLKKTPRRFIILHMCTINDNHMMHGSWDIDRDGCNCYFSFWTIFYPFAPLVATKIKKMKKNEKIPWRCHHFMQVHQKSWSFATLSLRYGAWQM